MGFAATATLDWATSPLRQIPEPRHSERLKRRASPGVFQTLTAVRLAGLEEKPSAWKYFPFLAGLNARYRQLKTA